MLKFLEHNQHLLGFIISIVLVCLMSWSIEFKDSVTETGFIISVILFAGCWRIITALQDIIQELKNNKDE